MKKKIIAILFVLALAKQGLAGPTEDMHAAILQNNFQNFKAALQAGADVNAYNSYGNTALIQAVVNPEMVSELIAAKANLNQFNKANNHSALSVSCFFGLDQTVKLLVDAGANVNNVDATLGVSPLNWALSSGLSIPSIQLLVAKGANTSFITKSGQSIFIHFAGAAQSPAVRCKKMKDIGTFYKNNKLPVSDVFEHSKESNWSSIEARIDLILGWGYSIDQEFQDTVPATVPNAIEVNRILKKHRLLTWPLYAAVMNLADRSGIMSALLAKGANPNKQYGTLPIVGLNRCAIHALAKFRNYADAEDDAKVLAALKKAGADLDARDGMDYTALMYAAINGNTPFIKGILLQQPNLNLTQKEVERSSETNVLSGNTTMYVKKTWRTARDWAAEMKQNEAYDLIKSAGGKGAREVR